MPYSYRFLFCFLISMLNCFWPSGHILWFCFFIFLFFLSNHRMCPFRFAPRNWVSTPEITQVQSGKPIYLWFVINFIEFNMLFGWIKCLIDFQYSDFAPFPGWDTQTHTYHRNVFDHIISRLETANEYKLCLNMWLFHLNSFLIGFGHSEINFLDLKAVLFILSFTCWKLCSQWIHF